MVLLDSSDVFFTELEQMFALCRERAAGTVYVTLKNVKAGKGAPAGEGEGWLARAKVSNKKARKISCSVPNADISNFRERIGRIKRAAAASTIAGGTKKRPRATPRKKGAKQSSGGDGASADLSAGALSSSNSSIARGKGAP